MGTKRVALAGLIAAGLIAAACGDDSTDTSSATTAAPGAATTAGAAVTSAAAPTAVDPSLPALKIGFLGTESGALAVANRHYSLEMAIAELNAKGGAYGHKIEYTAYDAGTSADTASTAVKKAISDKMNVLVGLGFTATVQATAPDIAASGIPLLFVAQSPLLNKSTLKLDIGYRIGPTADVYAESFVKYALDQTPQPKSILNEHTTDTSGALVGKAINQLLKDAKYTGTVTERALAATATDATEAVLAAKTADFIIMNNVPTVGQVFLKQRTQQGLTTPAITDTGVPGYLASGANTMAEMKNVAYSSGCSTDTLDTPEATAYRTAYKAKYPSESNTDGSAAYNYQAVYYIAAAANLAKSIEPKDLKPAFGKLDLPGPCGQWKTDADNNLHHDVAVVDITTGKLLKRYTRLVGVPGLQADVPTTVAASPAASTAAAS
ncbi:MAG: ABC transporter substrate-binding protein [Acidimicrobiia bacterium]